MLTLIKRGELFSPNYLGVKDVLIAGDKIELINDSICINEEYLDKVIDAKNKIVAPGFIDSHVHILGGGGEGGYKTRTPEINLTDITKGGVTTVIGVLGTDGITRNIKSLIAKCRALEEEGISCYIYTGSYHIPVKSLTGEIADDLVLIDKIIGVGEIALSDHRSSQPTIEELSRIAASAKLGGMLSGKAGVLNIHVGDGERQIDYIDYIVENYEISISQFIPTHMNRNVNLFNRSLKHIEKGGIADFTTSTSEIFSEEEEIKCSKALRIIFDKKLPIDNITFSSDGQGSLPDFDENGKFKGLGIGEVTSLFNEVRDAVLEENIPFDAAIRVITENPARILKLRNKGKIQKGFDGDIVIINKESLEINTVIAKGNAMIEHGKTKIKGTFE